MLLERVVYHFAPVARRLILRSAGAEDATAEWRSKIEASSLVGKSPALAKVLREISVVAPLDVPVLLTGASGSGKSLAAEVIHKNSACREGPFIALNCANLPETLVESELFGAEKGAYSSATDTREGKVFAAEGGTLFLDEIAALPEAAQTKLLQLLQSGEYFRLGNNEKQQANVRIMTATNADLEERVRDRSFRGDLYFRINVYPIRMPALAERVEDIPLIAQQIASSFSRQQRFAEVRLSAQSLFALKTQEWTGNVRELANVIQRAIIHAQAEGVTEAEPQHFNTPDVADAPSSFRHATRRFQKEFVAAALEATDWNVQKAAEKLQIARAHLYNLIKEHGLRRP